LNIFRIIGKGKNTQIRRGFYMESKVYFGCGCKYLDPYELQYKWFGAVWCYKEDTKMVMRYWFAEKKCDLFYLLKNAGWEQWTLETDPAEVNSVYRSLRSTQQKQDWECHSRLALRTAFCEPWKDMKHGWYILRSNDGYPVHISALHKKKIFVWLEHVSVCESEEELQQFIDQVNLKHSITLKSAPLSYFKR
jgi:hypothetical protein